MKKIVLFIIGLVLLFTMVSSAGAKPYVPDTILSYKATLTQNSDGLPVVTVLQNDFTDVQWIDMGAGEFAFIAPSQLTLDHTKVQLSGLQWNGQAWVYLIGDESSVYIKTANGAGVLQDYWLLQTYFEVTVGE